MSYQRVPAQWEHEPRFIICVDYGTTFSGVAWTLTAGETPTLADVNVVANWGRIAQKVPSLYTYSSSEGELWGYDIGDNAYVIRWSKLDLEAPKRVDALIALKRTIQEAAYLNFGSDNVLSSHIPRHLIKSTSDVITDYLMEVANATRLDIENKRDPETLRQFPIDLVITHPAEWDHRARNLTFRAVNEAFRHVFHEIADSGGVVRLATEPEACAQFTMRCGQDQNLNRLKKGECFIVVDAGGGTVDLVSYIVEQVEPTFEVRKITDVCGRKCGASRIDESFTRFLQERLGQDYDQLQNLDGTLPEQHGRGSHFILNRRRQILLNKFQEIKHTFEGPPRRGQPERYEMLDLIEGIGAENDPAKGIQDGLLQISSADLVTMFKESVNGTIELITQQLTLVDQQRLRVKTIFLSGGFSESPYLQNRLKALARGWRLNLGYGNDRWSAVAQGGVLMGLGLGCRPPPPCKECPFHIGVVLAERWTVHKHELSQHYTDAFDKVSRAKESIKWLVAKGDLITQDEGIETTQSIVKKLSSNGNRAGTVTLVFAEFEATPQPPTRFEDIPLNSRRWTKDLEFDLGGALLDRVPNQRYFQAEMQLDVSVDQQGVRCELLTGRTKDFMGRTGAPGTLLDSHAESFDNPAG
ncbi:hypothetical protein AK830_g4680 [Neonectria ditissima]|uniref:Uncharacterized protein n=1 Tax=Neonectria ditissima TaxID=78410 RepID=A0A0P7B5T8_9HYPO|nr:hypothetical protein AK830_g4680 [Neonectria ditissima]